MSEQQSGFVKSEILPFFPSLVWRFRLSPENEARVSASVIAKGDALAGHLKGESDAKFMQTHQKLHLDPDMAELSGHIQSAAGAVLQMLALDQHPCEITGMWGEYWPSRSHSQAAPAQQ